MAGRRKANDGSKQGPLRRAAGARSGRCSGGAVPLLHEPGGRAASSPRGHRCRQQGVAPSPSCKAMAPRSSTAQARRPLRRHPALSTAWTAQLYSPQAPRTMLPPAGVPSVLLTVTLGLCSASRRVTLVDAERLQRRGREAVQRAHLLCGGERRACRVLSGELLLAPQLQLLTLSLVAAACDWAAKVSNIEHLVGAASSWPAN